MREEWGSRAGFILATIGAAVGLGNIWRFAYIAGENGGAVFLFVYLLFVALIGLPLMIAELALGRRGASNAVDAFAASCPGSLWRHAGWLGVIAAVAILSYYAVVAGWALRYFAGTLTGALWREAGAGYGAFFEGFIAGSAEPMLYQAVMLVLAALVVAAGVKGGIERINLWIMPLLAAIVCGLAVHALLLPGSARGVAFLFAPDWSALARPALYLNALGQAFFSLGVGMAVFVTYGGYLGGQTGIPRSAALVAMGDTSFALVAGLAVFPAVFALGGDPAAGPRLAFITFPQILLDMPAGRIVGVVFFLLLSAAALTSMISLLEVAVAVLAPRAGWSRPRATAIVAVALFLLGLPSALGYGSLSGWTLGGRPLLDAIDHIASNFLLPLSGLAIALFVGWRLRAAEAVADADLAGSALAPAWLWLLRIGAPLTILVILLRTAGLF